MRRTGRSQLKLRRKAGGATHAFHHTRQQQPKFMKDLHTKKFRKLTCESEQGYHATEVMEKRVLDMQPKVMSQACHVVIPRPIVDNMQPAEGGGQRMSCVMLSFLVVLFLITHIPRGRTEMSVFILILMGLWRLSLGHMMYVTGGAAREKDFQTAF